MRYTVTKQRVYILGEIWWPLRAKAAQVRDLSGYDLESMDDPRDRGAVARWLDAHAGDFSRVLDFQADFHLGNEHVVHRWLSEDNELAFQDCMWERE